MLHWLRVHPVAGFIALTLGISWLIWMPGVVWYTINQPEGFPAVLILLALIGAYGPTAAALIMTAVLEGRAGVRDLLARLGRWRVGVQWWVAALLLMPAIASAAALLYAITARLPLGIDGQMLALAPISLLAALPFGPMGEELGWRGYLQTRLQSQRSTFSAAVWVGITWFLWHIPLFWVPGAALPLEGIGPAESVLYAAQIVATSVLAAWVFSHARGSVLIAILMHASVNGLAGLMIRTLLSDLSVTQRFMLGWVQVALSWALIGLLLWRHGRELGRQS